jgi:hypothetical protein
MTDYVSMLCVGGPLAGRRYDAQPGAGFVTPVRTSSLAEFDPSHYMPNATVSVVLTHYRAETFHTPQGDVAFWTPEGQTALETITLLLETYEEARIIADGINSRGKSGDLTDARS